MSFTTTLAGRAANQRHSAQPYSEGRIAAWDPRSVSTLTAWTSVASETFDAIYRWLFGNEALFVAGAEMRVEAGL